VGKIPHARPVAVGRPGASPRPAATPVRVKPKKSPVVLYGIIAAVVVGLGAAAFVFWPRKEPLTQAQIYAAQKEAEARDAALKPATPSPTPTPKAPPKVAVAATPAPTPPPAPQSVATPPPVAMATPVPSTPKPASEIEKWIAQVETSFQESYRRDVEGPFDMGLGELRRSYRAALDQQSGLANASGRIEESTAWRDERQRFFDAGQRVPPDNSDNPLPGIAPLRASFRAQLAKLEGERLTRARALFSRFDAALTPAITQLTQKQRLEDAQLLRTKRDEVQKAWLDSTSANPTPTPSLAEANRPKTGANTPPSPVIKKYPRGDDRKAAEWVFGVGGTVEILEGGKPRKVAAITELPKGRFSLHSVRLHFASGPPARPIEDLDSLAGLDDLAVVEINKLPLQDEALAPLTTLPKLGRLIIEGTQITDAAIGYLTLMPNLRAFRPQNSKSLTGRRLEELAGSNITELSLQGCTIAPEAWPQLARLKKLVRLNLRYAAIRDADLQHLAELGNLQQLHLNRTEVTLAALLQLKSLREIRDFGWNFTSGKAREELTEIARTFPKISIYSVDGITEYTEADLAALDVFRELRTAYLYGKTIDDNAVRGLLTIKGLKAARMSTGTAITDQSLALLAGHKGIEEIICTEAHNLTDAGLLKLAPMKGLRRLEIKNCSKITPSGLAAWQKARPDVMLVR